MSDSNVVRTKPEGHSRNTTVSTADRLLHAITWRVPSWLFHYYHTYLISTDKPKLILREHNTYFKRFVSTADLPLMEKFGISPALVIERLAVGDRSVIIGRGDEILSIVWGASRKCYLKLPGAVLDPGETGVILYAGFTAEEARLKGLYNASLDLLYRHYLAQGRSRIFGAIHSTNTNSFKLHLRMNFEVVGETYFVRFLGINVCFYKQWPFATRRFHVFLRRPPDGLHWV